MVGIAEALPEITEQGRARLDLAMADVGATGQERELAELLAKRDALLALA